jgi:hypothetical protein
MIGCVRARMLASRQLFALGWLQDAQHSSWVCEVCDAMSECGVWVDLSRLMLLQHRQWLRRR